MLKMSNKANTDFFGFNLNAGTVYGDFDGVKFTTHGTIKNNKMNIYFYNDGIWEKTSVVANENEYAKAVTKKYGEVILKRNQRYKGSPKEQKDIMYGKIKDAYNKAVKDYIVKRDEYYFFQNEVRFFSGSIIR